MPLKDEKLIRGRNSELELFTTASYKKYKKLLLYRPSVYLIVSDISSRRFGLHFCRRKFRYIFNHFYAVHPGSY